MYSVEELEALSYRELQKLAKNRKIRQSGKGITKKVLVSVLLDSVTESFDESEDSLPLQELEVKSFPPVTTPEKYSFEECNFLDAESELNDSNKENTNRRRLTYEIANPKIESPLAVETRNKKTSGSHHGKEDGPKNKKRVRIQESPRRSGISTPKPSIKIVKTPIPNRKSSGRPGGLGLSKTPITAQKSPHVNKTSVLKASLSVKKSALTNQSNTPTTVQNTPRLNKAVILRLASSVKKTALQRNQSKIPKLDVKKPPNFANIHQNAFDKMDSLWDVEHQRVLRKRNAESGGAIFTFKSKTEAPKKMNSKAKTRKPSSSETQPAVFKFGAHNEPAAKSSTISKFHAKDIACRAVNKSNPTRGKAMKEEQRSFLKGVRLNRRFQMQMQNRGLL